jgi:hypothetical protein
MSDRADITDAVRIEIQTPGACASMPRCDRFLRDSPGGRGYRAPGTRSPMTPAQDMQRRLDEALRRLREPQQPLFRPTDEQKRPDLPVRPRKPLRPVLPRRS